VDKTNQTENVKEWTCRILLTLVLYLVASGYISYIQTMYQLVSPLIPSDTAFIIVEPTMKTSLITAAGLLAGLWLYFFRKRTLCIVVLALCILFAELAGFII
jgi:hypothetical protein